MKEFERVVEDICGEPIDVIRKRPLDEQSRRTADRSGISMMMIPRSKEWKTSKEIDSLLETALKRQP